MFVVCACRDLGHLFRYHRTHRFYTNQLKELTFAAMDNRSVNIIRIIFIIKYVILIVTVTVERLV